MSSGQTPTHHHRLFGQCSREAECCYSYLSKKRCCIGAYASAWTLRGLKKVRLKIAYHGRVQRPFQSPILVSRPRPLVVRVHRFGGEAPLARAAGSSKAAAGT
jgi:hypothetical protein